MPIPSRAPRISGRRSEPPEGSDLRFPLRLTATRGRLGLELYESVDIGPLQVLRLSATLPGLKFPIDLSGGVRLFRNRRGVLEHFELGLSLDTLSRWLDGRLKDALGGSCRPISAWALADGIGIGVVGNAGAVAFDLLWAPEGEDARFVVVRPRGADLAGPALAAALPLVDTAFGKFAERSGRIVTVRNLGKWIARATMPRLGARVPRSVALHPAPWSVDGNRVTLLVDRALPPDILSETAISAVELGHLTRAADDALAEGDLEAARARYLAALERAPRHPEISKLIAELDSLHEDRTEAALALLSEAISPMEAGNVGSTLLSRIGATDSAADALRSAMRSEVFAPVTALLWLSLSRLESGAPEREAALDAAVASCPGLASVRWARFEARVKAGRTRDALSDAEHLEAAASGSRARHDALTRAAHHLLQFGYESDAGRLFERALRYVPDDPEACAGLGRALLVTGRTERAVPLLERAIALGEERVQPQDGAALDLANILAASGDYPQAIARARQVRAPSREAVVARGREAEWRAHVGDLAGASLAYARMRETAELNPAADAAAAVSLLRRAAAFEMTQDDPAAAERHLSVALKILPRDKAVAEEYRRAAALVQAKSRQGSR